MSNRREFIVQFSLGGAALLAGNAVVAAPMVVETDAGPAGLGYKADATKVDKVKFPTYAAGQLCLNCALYHGKPTDVAGGCVFFPGKDVAGKGWCTAYGKKA